MKFKDILEQWEDSEKKKKVSSGKRVHPLEDWLKSGRIIDKDASVEEYLPGKADRIEKRQTLRNMNPQAELDLHGKTREEAIDLLNEFLRDAQLKDLRKVLIIHGKGIHSKTGPTIGKAVRNFLEASPIAGETGTPHRSMGGSGAAWVIIKEKEERYRSR